MDAVRENSQVLVVGAGPTGLTAALQLARRGYLPRIIDRKDGPTSLSKAVGISPRSLDLLEPTGVTADLLERGLKIRSIWFYAGMPLGHLDFSVLGHRFDFLLSLPQRDTEQCMVAALERGGVQVEWNTEFLGVEASGPRLVATLQAPEGTVPVSCDQIFGADGIHSAVRIAMGASFEGKTHGREWSIADVEIGSWPHEAQAAHLFFHGNGDVGFIIPIGKDRYRAVSNTPDAMARIPGGYRVERVLQSDRFRLPVRQASLYQVDGMTLGGDAAHVHSPVAARGMNLGIEDASAFAQRLAEGALAGYSAERRPVGHNWITFSERLLAMAQTTNPVAAMIRNLAIGAVTRLPPVERVILRRIAGTNS